MAIILWTWLIIMLFFFFSGLLFFKSLDPVMEAVEERENTSEDWLVFTPFIFGLALIWPLIVSVFTVIYLKWIIKSIVGKGI